MSDGIDFRPSTPSASSDGIDFKPSAIGLKSSLSQGTGDQQAGPVISPKGFISHFTPTKEQLPELIGGTIGGIAGGGNPLAVIGGGALGSAAGEAYKQLGQRVGLLKGEAPKTSTEAATGIAGAGLRGGAAQAVGLGISKVLSPFAASVTPEVKTGIEAARRAGVSPPLGTMTESPAVQGMERISEYGPFGAPITAQRQQAVKQLENFADKISEGMGPDKPAEFVADNVSAKIKGFKQAFDKAKDELFEPINKVLGDKPVNPENTINAIKNVLDQKAGGKEGKALLEGWLERLNPGENAVERASGRYSPATEKVVDQGVPSMLSPEVIESKPGSFSGSGGSLEAPSDIPSLLISKKLPLFNQLKAIRTEIGSRGNFNDPGVTGIKSQLEGIYAAASQDMQKFAEQNGMADALQKANDVYSTGIRKLQGSLVDALQNNAKDPAKLSSLYNIVFKKDNPVLIKAAKEVLGDDGFAQIRKQWFENLLKQSTSRLDGTDMISPSLLANNLRKLGSSLSEITADSPELTQKMADLNETAKLLTRGLKVNSGSQTGFINKINSVFGMMTAPMVRSNFGKTYLTTGFPVPGKVAGTAVQTGTQIGLQKIGDYVNQKKK